VSFPSILPGITRLKFSNTRAAVWYSLLALSAFAFDASAACGVSAKPAAEFDADGVPMRVEGLKRIDCPEKVAVRIGTLTLLRIAADGTQQQIVLRNGEQYNLRTDAASATMQARLRRVLTVAEDFKSKRAVIAGTRSGDADIGLPTGDVWISPAGLQLQMHALDASELTLVLRTKDANSNIIAPKSQPDGILTVSHSHFAPGKTYVMQLMKNEKVATSTEFRVIGGRAKVDLEKGLAGIQGDDKDINRIARALEFEKAGAVWNRNVELAYFARP
jgi:hypothetical protein